LADLKADDKIILATPRGRFLYRVRSETVVDPHDVSVLGQAVPAPSLTLTTCTPKFSAAQRLILTASLASEQVVQPSAVKTIKTLEHDVMVTERPSALASWLMALLWLCMGLAGLQLCFSLRNWRNHFFFTAIGVAAVPVAFLGTCFWLSPVLPTGL